MLKKGDHVGITACSNGLLQTERAQMEDIADVLERLGLVPEFSPYLYRQDSVFSGTGRQRAEALNAFYRDGAIRAIFDVSGGDVANGVLDDLDYELIRQNPKPMFGYSDLTTVLNAIYTKTGHASYLYQARCLVWESKIEQVPAFENSMFHRKNDLFHVDWRFLRGAAMKGVLLGGNIRCLLKLAGTPYWPDLRKKLLFLESYGGGVAQMATYLNQLKQMGVFGEISGLLLGTFTKLEQSGETPDIARLVLDATEEHGFPVAATRNVGHGSDSKCLILGKRYDIKGNV